MEVLAVAMWGSKNYDSAHFPDGVLPLIKAKSSLKEFKPEECKKYLEENEKDRAAAIKRGP
jgi:hypothetical protein